MKKLVVLFCSLFLIVSLVACNNQKNGNEKQTKLTVGASNVPHAEILEQAKPLLAKKGIDLKIVKFQDYILPNKALESKEIDANYFQHIPYLNAQIKENGYDFVNAGGIHIEPIGIYSKKYKSLDKLPTGAEIIMSNSVADHGRILTMLEEKGLIKLKEGIDKTTATVKDITDNPKKLIFKTDVEAGLLPKVFENNEGDAVVINANYALDAGLDPKNDPIAVESAKNNPYVNVIAVRKGDEDKKEIKQLVSTLHSKKIQDYINKKYKGAVIPANE